MIVPAPADNERHLERKADFRDEAEARELTERITVEMAIAAQRGGEAVEA